MVVSFNMSSTTFDLVLSILGAIGSVGILQVILTRDSESVNKCRLLCYELKRLLDDLAEYTLYTERSIEWELPKIKEIKKVIEQLYLEKEGLAFTYHYLDHLLDQSLALFDKLRVTEENLEETVYQMSIELSKLWGQEARHPFKVSKLIEVQKYLYKSYSRRLLARGAYFLKSFVGSSQKFRERFRTLQF